MKKVLFIIGLMFLGFLAKSQNFGQFASAVWVHTQTGDQYYNFTGDSGNQIGNSAFSGSLGSYNQNSAALVLKGAQIKTWKNYTANVCGGSLYYVIYPTGNRPTNPNFIPLNLSWKDNCSGSSFPSGGQCGNPRDQKWANENSAIDLTSYPANNYTLEIYLQYTGSNTSGNGCETTQYISNYGNNYKMTFTISPPDINSFKNSGSLSTVTPTSTAISGTENYIQTTEYLSADQSQKNINITYFDGLGRPKQQIAVAASPKGNDIVTPIEYDGFGRQTKNWLPLPQTTTSNAAYIQTVDNTTATSIYGNSLLYSEKKLEASPLDRLQEQGNPGTDWAIGSGHTQVFAYDSNTGSEVKRFKATAQWNPANLDFDESLTLTPDDAATTSGYYKASTLYKNSVTDEDGNLSTEFKNGQGQTILVRKNDGTNNIDTYYIYDDFDHLVYVLPPLAWSAVVPSAAAPADQTILSNLCYQYKYDSKNRLVEKKLPGKGWESMVYDLQDRLVATQDTNLKAKSQWLFTKYDQFGRVVYTGLSSGGLRASEQGIAEGLGSNNEARATSSFLKNGTDVYYSSVAYPTSFTTLLSVNYYDDYSKIIAAASIPASIQNQVVITGAPTVSLTNSNTSVSTKGLPVASYVKNIEDDNWTKTYTWYDIKGRTIGNDETNYLGGYTKTESLLDFNGVSRLTTTSHKRSPTDAAIQISEQFTFDSHYRPLKHYHNIGSNAAELLSDNTYNEAGQLTNKQVGNNLQSIDYKYNVRGWLTQINDPNTLGTKLFGYNIKYSNPANPSVAPAKYNGNIAEVDWANSDDGILRRYGYTYDKLNRLLQATYQKPSATTPITHAYDEGLSYDQNGNIISLSRYGTLDGTQANLIDALSYSYKGNQLTGVNDYSGNPSGFLDNTPYGTADEYAYDDNGNMIRDDNKKITSISYNFLNLPTEIVFPNQNKVNYYYRADGTKVKKVRTIFQGNSTSLETTDYLDGFQYESTGSPIAVTSPKLLFFPTAEGYYNTNINSNPYGNAIPVYVYNYTDHLGNVRVSYYKDPTSNSIVLDKATNYYPFGLEHEGYNSILSQSQNYNYKYQGQELQETGFYSFKWRNYMPDVGRFFNIDKLAEKYSYNTPYAFQENKMGLGRELEGLELYRKEDFNPINLHKLAYSFSDFVKETTNKGLKSLGNLADKVAENGEVTGDIIKTASIIGGTISAVTPGAEEFVPEFVELYNAGDKISNAASVAKITSLATKGKTKDAGIEIVKLVVADKVGGKITKTAKLNEFNKMMLRDGANKVIDKTAEKTEKKKPEIKP